MKTNLSLALLTLLLIVSCSTKNTITKPPLAQTVPAEDVYFGMKITDPYRNLENLKDSGVVKWYKDQANYSRKILNNIPGRKQLIDKMVEFDGRKSSRIYSLQITDNDRYFYLKQTPKDETGKLYYREGYEGKEILLYDPQNQAKDSTQKYVISTLMPSIDGTKIAFDIALNGSESSIMHIMDVEKQSLYPEEIDRCWVSSASWLPDNYSFLYNRLNSSDVHQIDREKDSKSFLHVIGTDPSTDLEILSRAKYPQLGIQPEDIPIVFFDKDCQMIFGLLATVDNRYNLYYAPVSELKKPNISWKRLFKPEDDVYNFATDGKDLFVYTPKGASNFKILRTSLANPDLSKAEVLVPEDPQRKLTDFIISVDGLYYTLTEDGVKSKVYFLPKGENTARELELPFAAGTANIRSKGINYSNVWVTIMGWSNDFQRYAYSPQTNEFKLENLSTKPDYPEFKDLVVEELMIKSHDGVMVPLSLVYKKGISKDGNNPVLFYGYGAYGSSMNPFFSPELLLWTSENGILAIPHVRGGGELGEQWHKGGFKTTKPNTWKDLIACADYLVSEKYTSAQKIAINSASAGGILVGRAMTERPDLFAAVIPNVGCLNTLRAEESPNGPVNVPEFGTVKDSAECMALIEMDSYLHIRDGEKYPATLITAGMNDPRVIAWQPGKFAARLQAANKSDKPILFLTDFEAGHGIGDTKTKSFESLADMMSFSLWHTGQTGFQPE